MSCDSHTMKYCSALKWNKLLRNVTTWVTLKIIFLSIGKWIRKSPWPKLCSQGPQVLVGKMTLQAGGLLVPSREHCSWGALCGEHRWESCWCPGHQDGCRRMGEVLPCGEQQGVIAVIFKDPWSLPSSFTLHAPLLRWQASKMPRSFLPVDLLTSCSLTIQQTCAETMKQVTSVWNWIARFYAAHILV